MSNEDLDFLLKKREELDKLIQEKISKNQKLESNSVPENEADSITGITVSADETNSCSPLQSLGSTNAFLDSNSYSNKCNITKSCQHNGRKYNVTICCFKMLT